MKTIEELFEIFDELTPWDQERVFEIIRKKFDYDYKVIMNCIPTGEMLDFLESIGALDEIKDEKYQEGYDDGYDEGHNDGYDEGYNGLED